MVGPGCDAAPQEGSPRSQNKIMAATQITNASAKRQFMSNPYAVEANLPLQIERATHNRPEHLSGAAEGGSLCLSSHRRALRIWDLQISDPLNRKSRLCRSRPRILPHARRGLVIIFVRHGHGAPAAKQDNHSGRATACLMGLTQPAMSSKGEFDRANSSGLGQVTSEGLRKASRSRILACRRARS
jgi:hypothetical protein